MTGKCPVLSRCTHCNTKTNTALQSLYCSECTSDPRVLKCVNTNVQYGQFELFLAICFGFMQHLPFAFPESLSLKAKSTLFKVGVKIRLNLGYLYILARLNYMKALEERFRCGAKPSGGINTWSHIRLAQQRKESSEITFKLLGLIHLHSCLST